MAAATTTADFLVGATIGEGAYGKVVHATHKTTEKDVAIKVLTKQSIQKDPALMTVAMKERRLLSDFQESEHVVSLWASFHDSECLYFVMECLAGGDLAHVIRSGLQDQKQQWTETIPNYSRQLVAALEFIHSRAVIHADLKPENVLLTTTGKLKLADFGAAIELQSSADKQSAALSKEQMRFIGTADYASPEVIRGALLLSVAIDLWSLGCVLYAMWEGASPFHDESDALAIQRIMRYCADDDGDERLVLPQTNHMPDDWKSLIRNLLTPDPSGRRGMIDFEARTSTSGDEDVVYTSIRESPCLLRTASCEEEEEDEVSHFRAPEPSWWVETQSSDKRDGAEGWSVFLL